MFDQIIADEMNYNFYESEDWEFWQQDWEKQDGNDELDYADTLKSLISPSYWGGNSLVMGDMIFNYREEKHYMVHDDDQDCDMDHGRYDIIIWPLGINIVLSRPTRSTWKAWVQPMCTDRIIDNPQFLADVRMGMPVSYPGTQLLQSIPIGHDLWLSYEDPRWSKDGNIDFNLALHKYSRDGNRIDDRELTYMINNTIEGIHTSGWWWVPWNLSQSWMRNTKKVYDIDLGYC